MPTQGSAVGTCKGWYKTQKLYTGVMDLNVPCLGLSTFSYLEHYGIRIATSSSRRSFCCVPSARSHSTLLTMASLTSHQS